MPSLAFNHFSLKRAYLATGAQPPTRVQVPPWPHLPNAIALHPVPHPAPHLPIAFVLLVCTARHDGQRLQVPPALKVLGRALREEADCVDDGDGLAVADARLEEVEAEALVVGHAI